MYADLEESLGTVDSTKAVYNRIVDLKIATPQIIINYALFLEENNFFEEAFKVSVTKYGRVLRLGKDRPTDHSEHLDCSWRVLCNQIKLACTFSQYVR